jgi:hypothetical protein
MLLRPDGSERGEYLAAGLNGGAYILRRSAGCTPGLAGSVPNSIRMVPVQLAIIESHTAFAIVDVEDDRLARNQGCPG